MKSQPHPPHTDSFYHLSAPLTGEMLCQGTACFVARHCHPDRWRAASSREPRVYCLGKCYLAPASSAEDVRPRIEVHAPEAIVLAHVASGGARTLDAYAERGSYPALEQALRQPAEEIIQAVELSALRGRGGAGFPTGRKWRAVSRQNSDEKFVIANADEGDPGAYVDRFLMEEDPHGLIEAMAIAGYAVGAPKGYIYLRKEYPRAHQVLQQALAEARRAGFLGDSVLRTHFVFDIEIALGQGSYVCGEETALIRSMEGKRPEVMPRPPYPSEHGLFGKPTLVNNVETLASIPWIVRHGGEAYGRLGFSHSRGTKVVSLNSLFCRPGLYEVEFGLPVRQIVEELGGGLKQGGLKGVIIGGPLAGILPPEQLDAPFGFEELRTLGAGVGHGGIVAFDEHTSIRDLVHHVAAFAAYESCGKCTPCRLGSRRMEQMFGQILPRGSASIQEKTEWPDLVSALARTSLCGLGTGLAEFAGSVSRYYAKELEACF
ncbi:MAG: NADH-quinone oxidoreductase subunit D, partial [Acidobacteria bacterium]|nr:NADH-quinone oxidoreductase subunit D [Acidobacteriota bacterium]